MDVNYCQSCGMPLREGDEMFGTVAGGGMSSDYCKYCYQNGAFTADRSMDEMVEFCAPYMAEANPGMGEDEAKRIMRDLFPTLKRWKASV